MIKSKNLFYAILAVCGLAIIVISLFVYTNKSIIPKSTTMVGTSIIQPEDPNKAGLALYPDLPLTLIPKESVSVKFVVEHRSALNSKTILIRGAVVRTLLGENACPPDRGMCAQQRIFLADTAEENRNKLYDLTVLVNEEDQNKDYPIGKIVEIQGTVNGGKIAVVARKLD